MIDFSRIKKINWPIYSVVADGAMAHPDIAEGRIIPGLIIDTFGGSEVSDLITLHYQSPPGDAIFNWSTQPFNNRNLFLDIEFKKPIDFHFSIAFAIPNNNNLIDGIIKSRGFYLLSGKQGDKVSDLSIKRIMCEVPNTGFDKKWEEIYLKSLCKKYGKLGLPKKESVKAARAQMSSSRQIWRFRQSNK